MEIRTCGVYAIIDKQGKRYVGSSRRIEIRWKEHKKSLNDNNHHAKYLQRAWNKYGSEYFIFKILEECPEELKIQREQFHLDISSEYNSSKLARGPSGETLIYSTERRKKISERLKGNKHLVGHVHSEETKKKISEKNKGRKASDKTIEKARERMIQRNRENPPMKGRKLSEQRKQHLSKLAKERHKKNADI